MSSKSHSHRPSLSNWLSRTSTGASHKSANSIPYAPTKPVRISEPKFTRSLEMLNNQRSGPLGSGATVVLGTPHDALSGSGVQFKYNGEREDAPQAVHVNKVEETHDQEEEDNEDAPDDLAASDEEGLRELPSPPRSPPLPPLPYSPFARSSPDLSPKERHASPPRPTRAPPPPPPQTSTLRPSLKNRSPPNSEYSPEVPSLPNNIAPSPPQPPFEPILASGVPTSAIDPSKIIVSLETSTMTYRATLNTLTSRPSYLSQYLTSLLPKTELDDASTYSDDASTYHNYLTSHGLLSPTSFSLHVFLDRPSAPYAHILSYLRSVPSTPEAPEVLPRGVRLQSSSSSRLEALLELRDEARYLDLDDLYKLCTDELRQRQAPTMHTRGYSSGSSGSIHSLRALRELVAEDRGAGCRESYDVKSIRDSEIGYRPPVTPLSLTGRSRSRTRHGIGSVQHSPPAPAGRWI